MRRTASEPIWKVERETGLELVAVAEFVLALSEVLLWVINQLQVVSNFLGVTFDEEEKQVIDLFVALKLRSPFQARTRKIIGETGRCRDYDLPSRID